jgi:hypothetical protein
MTKAKLFLTAFALFCFSVASSLPPGKYYKSFDFSGISFFLTHSNLFIYSSYGCAMYEEGYGTYHIENDTLILAFADIPNATQIHIDTVFTLNTDTIVVNLEHFSPEGIPLYPVWRYSGEKYIQGSSYNNNDFELLHPSGKSRITITTDTSDSYTLTIIPAFLEPINIDLKEEFDYRIKLTGIQDDNNYIYNELKKFKIIKEYDHIEDIYKYIGPDNDTIGLELIN